MITKDELKQIAFDARIACSDDEIEEYIQKLNETIAMVSVIHEIDLTGVEPLFYPNEQQAQFRNPDVAIVTEQSELLANTVTSEAGYFKLPAVLKDGES